MRIGLATKRISSTFRLRPAVPVVTPSTLTLLRPLSRPTHFRAMTTSKSTSTSSFVFDPPPIPSVAIENSSERFPVHRIYCVGRNYSEHVKEMGGDPKTSVPTFFTKPADAIVPSGSSIPYPLATKELHYEVELVVCIGQPGVQISIENAFDHVFGYAVGIDLTRRDLQSDAKRKGMPWDSSKAFDQSAPISAIFTRSVHLEGNRKIQLALNGKLQQDAVLDQMIWSIPEIIHHLSHQFHLQSGDLIFTGTPSGVGPLIPGDCVQGIVEGLPDVTITIGEPECQHR